jgi:methyl coenzyme M reductase subunit C
VPKKFLFILILLGMILFAPGWINHLQAQERILIKEGDPFPEVVLESPVDPKDRAYLGISVRDLLPLRT